MTVEEYNQCVDNHADGLFRFVLARLRNEEEARDVVQDTFEKMWRLRNAIDGAKAKSYLFTAGYHTLIDLTRKRKETVDIESISSAVVKNPDYFIDTKKIIYEVLGRLPDIQQTVILLRDYEGYSYEEIGDITGLSASQVKVYIYRGRMTLKEYLVSPDHLI